MLLAVFPLSHCHKTLKGAISQRDNLYEWLNKHSDLCLFWGQYNRQAGFCVWSLVLVIGMMCSTLSCLLVCQLWHTPTLPQAQSHMLSEVLHAGHLLEGHTRTKRWVNNLLERQETEIIRSPLRGSHYQGPPWGASSCFTYYFTSTLACAIQRRGCAGSVKSTNSSTNRHILQHTAMTQQLWAAHYFLHPLGDDRLMTLFGFFGNVQGWVQNKIIAPYNTIKYDTILPHDNVCLCVLPRKCLPSAVWKLVYETAQMQADDFVAGETNHTVWVEQLSQP